MYDLIIIGAGPYGISLASFAQSASLSYKLIGKPMDFWENKMPADMFIRTQIKFTNISDPAGLYTLEKYAEEKKIDLVYPIKRKIFVDYGKWFIHKTGIEVEEDLVRDISLHDDRFTVVTEKGKTFAGRNIVVAIGITNSSFIPEPLLGFSKTFVTHTSEYTDYGGFSNKDVVVYGGGQSAWEAAALLNKGGANVTLVFRRPERLKPVENINKIQHEIADKFYHFPEDKKEFYQNLLNQPTVTDFLVPLVENKVTIKPSTSIKNVTIGDRNRLKIIFSTGEEMYANHIIAATGYKFNMERNQFLTKIIKHLKRNKDGTPFVDENFQTTLKGVYFAGPATATLHGPSFNVMAGTRVTARRIINEVMKKNKINL